MHLRNWTWTAAALLCATANAQWSSDPAMNLALAPQPQYQIEPRIAASGDGSSWIGWFDRRSGTYAVYAQHLDRAGNATLPPGGVLVDAHSNDDFSTFGWEIVADGEGGCVIVIADTRAGPNRDVYAYRLDANGTLLWGQDGVTLSQNADVEDHPTCARTRDGFFAVTWSRRPTTSAPGAIHVQKLSAAGQPQFPGEGVQIAGSGTDKPGLGHIVATPDGGWIVEYLQTAAFFGLPGPVRTQRFDAAGNPLWNGGVPLTIYDASMLEPYFDQRIVSDGAGGAVYAWCSRTATSFREVRVQHVSSAGTELLPHQGLRVSLDTVTGEGGPDIAFLPHSGDTIVAFGRNDSALNMSLAVQRITAAGARAFGANGIDLTTLDATYKNSIRCLPFGDGAQIYCFWVLNTQLDLAQILGFRISGSGALVWMPNVISVSNPTDWRDALSAVIDGTGLTRIAWHERRTSGTPNVYAQNVNGDGTLGNTSPCGTSNYCPAAPNSMGPGAHISSSGSTSIAQNDLTLTCSGLPSNTTGLWFYGANAVQVSFGNGFRCVGNPAFRLGAPQHVTPSGFTSLPLDLGAPPASTGTGAITTGSIWRFQFWYRNVAGGGAGFNLSDGLTAAFCP